MSMTLTPGQLTELLSVTVPAKIPVLIAGGPGMGKTDISVATGKMLGYNVRLRHPVIEEEIDYRGLPTFTDIDGVRGADFVPFADLRELMETTELRSVRPEIRARHFPRHCDHGPSRPLGTDPSAELRERSALEQTQAGYRPDDSGRSGHRTGSQRQPGNASQGVRRGEGNSCRP